MDVKLPDKQYFKIGEVAKLTSLNCSVLRFWESEFEVLRPLKSRSGQRLYAREDVELIIKIRQLLYEEKLTIAGARSRIGRFCEDDVICVPEAPDNGIRQKIVQEIRFELQRIRDSL